MRTGNQKFLFIVCAILLIAGLAVIAAPAADKLSPEDVVAKSVEAFAPADVRAPAEGRQLDCRATWRILVGGSGGLQGPGLLQSRGGKFHLHAEFNNNRYPGEDVVYRGEGDPVIQQLTPGRRSALGEFLYANPVAVRNGLMGGVYNTGWPLFHFDKSGAKLTAHGTRKVDGKKLNEFEYRGPKQGDTKIYLMFDPDTNQHVMTEYQWLHPATNTGNIAAPTGRDTVTTLTERFSEFRQAFGMNIPLVWTIRWNEENGGIQEWQFTLLKQKLDVPDEAFAVKP